MSGETPVIGRGGAPRPGLRAAAARHGQLSARRLNAVLLFLLHLERRFDPFFRRPFDAVFRGPLTALTTG